MNPRLCKDTGKVLESLRVFAVQKPCDYPKPPDEYIDADWCRVKIGKELLFTFGGVLSGISPITLTGVDAGINWEWNTPFPNISTPCGTLSIYFSVQDDGGVALLVNVAGTIFTISAFPPQICQTIAPDDPPDFVFPYGADGSNEFTVASGPCTGTASITVTNANSGGSSYSSSTHVQYSLAVKTHQHKADGKELWAAADCQADYDKIQEFLDSPCCQIAKVPKYITITFGGDWAFLGTVVLTYASGVPPLGKPGWIFGAPDIGQANIYFPPDPRYPNVDFCQPFYVSFSCIGHAAANAPDNASDYNYMIAVGMPNSSGIGSYLDFSPGHRCDDFSDIHMENDFSGGPSNPCNVGPYTASIRFGLTSPIGPAPFDPPAISGSGFGRPLYTLALFTGQIKNGKKNFTAENDRCCMGGLLAIGSIVDDSDLETGGVNPQCCNGTPIPRTMYAHFSGGITGTAILSYQNRVSQGFPANICDIWFGSITVLGVNRRIRFRCCGSPFGTVGFELIIEFFDGTVETPGTQLYYTVGTSVVCSPFEFVAEAFTVDGNTVNATVDKNP